MTEKRFIPLAFSCSLWLAIFLLSAPPAFSQDQTQPQIQIPPATQTAPGSSEMLAPASPLQNLVPSHKADTTDDETVTVDENGAAPDADAEGKTTKDVGDATSGITIEGGQKEEWDMEEVLKTVDKLPPEVQKDLMGEGNQAYQNCKNNVMLSNFYDCSCFALNYVNERIKRGPQDPYSKIVSTGDFKNCAFAPAIAGYSYKRCYNVLYLKTIGDKKMDNICTCTGKTLAKKFLERSATNMRYVDRLFTAALTECRHKNGF